MARLRILALTSRLPYPIVSGGQARKYHLLREMSKEFDVDLLSIHEESISPLIVGHLRSFLRRAYFHSMSKGVSRLKAIRHAITSGMPLQIGYYYDEPVIRWVKDNYRSYDLVFCFHIRTAEYVLDLQCKKVVDLVDAISLGYKRALESGPSFWWKLIYRFELPRLLSYERKVISSFDKSLVVSAIDKNFLVSHGAQEDRLIIVKQGTEILTPERSTDRITCRRIDVLFHGKMDYPPNEAACIYFVDEILPCLNRDRQYSFFIVGHAPTRQVRRLANVKSVFVTGYVHEIANYLESALVVVAPITYGAGIKTKVLEAMGMGKAVVTTTVGAEGITGQNGVHFFVEDDPIRFAECVRMLLESQDLRNRMGAAARELILEGYTWDEAGRTLFDVLHSVGSS